MPNNNAQNQKLNHEEVVSSAAAGALAGIWLACGIGVATTLTAPLSRRSACLKGAVRILTGVRVDEQKDVGPFFKNSLFGASLGLGLLVSAAALNWMVEMVDSINGDPK